MGSRGLHIALTSAELSELRAMGPDEQAEHIAENLEEAKFGTPDACETDSSWAYIHSAMNGTDPDGPLRMAGEPNVGLLGRLFGRSPVKKDAGEAKFVVIGHEPILSSEDEYIGLIPCDRVAGVARALESISNDELGERVRETHQRFKASGRPEDASEYAMSWYPGLIDFYRTATDAGKNVIFTVSY